MQKQNNSQKEARKSGAHNNKPNSPKLSKKAEGKGDTKTLDKWCSPKGANKGNTSREAVDQGLAEELQKSGENISSSAVEMILAAISEGNQKIVLEVGALKNEILAQICQEQNCSES